MYSNLLCKPCFFQITGSRRFTVQERRDFRSDFKGRGEMVVCKE